MCDKYQDQISLYIDGQLTEIETKEFLEHIELCPNCKQMLQELTSLVSELNNLEELDLPDDLHNKIMEEITILNNKKENRFTLNKITTINFKKLSIIAAVFVFSVFSISAMLNLITSPKSFAFDTPQLFLTSDSSDSSAEIEEEHVGEYASNKIVQPDQRKMGAPLALARDTTRYVNKSTVVTIESEQAEEIHDYLTSNYAINNMELNSYGQTYVEVTTNNDDYDELMEQLENMGEIKSTYVTEFDNTNDIIILNSRLSEKKSQSERYLELMKKSENATELLYLTNAISDVEMSITNLKNNLDTLYSQYYNPVVSVHIEKTNEPEDLPKVTLSAKLQNTFITSLNDTSNVFTNISITIATIIPYLILIIILFLIIRFIIRKKRRKKNEK